VKEGGKGREGGVKEEWEELNRSGSSYRGVGGVKEERAPPCMSIRT